VCVVLEVRQQEHLNCNYMPSIWRRSASETNHSHWYPLTWPRTISDNLHLTALEGVQELAS
jgi:hypothetical protein